MAKMVSTKKSGTHHNTERYNEQSEIERLAYQYFVERGYEHGHDQEDWCRAEAVVKSRRS